MKHRRRDITVSYIFSDYKEFTGAIFYCASCNLVPRVTLEARLCITVKPRLCELNGPDNRKCLSECHATLGGALRESQSEPSEMDCISYGACEHETRTDLCYEVK